MIVLKLIFKFHHFLNRSPEHGLNIDLEALIGTSHTGCIPFVSKLWFGRVSDKEITIKSGALRLSDDSHNPMADREFDIFDILLAGVTLNIPLSKVVDHSKLLRKWKTLLVLLL